MYTTFTLSALYDERFAIWLSWAKNLHPALYTLSYLNYIYICPVYVLYLHAGDYTEGRQCRRCFAIYGLKF